MFGSAKIGFQGLRQDVKIGHLHVDFYIPDDSLLVQVSYSIADAAARKCEIDAIKKTAMILQSKTMQIDTYNEEEVFEEDGVRVEVVSIFKWEMEG